MTDYSRTRIVCASRRVWALRDTLRSLGFSEILPPWTLLKREAIKAVWAEPHDRSARDNELVIAPAPVWRLSPDHEAQPLGLQLRGALAAPQSWDGQALEQSYTQLARLRLCRDLHHRSDWPSNVEAPKTVIACGTLSSPQLRTLMEPTNARWLASLPQPVVIQTPDGVVYAPLRSEPLARGLSSWAALERSSHVIAIDQPDTLLAARELDVSVIQAPTANDVGPETLSDAQATDYDAALGALFAGAVFFDAWDRKTAPFEAVTEQAAWLRDRLWDNPKQPICVGVSPWKRDSVNRVLSGPLGAPHYVSSVAAAIQNAKQSEAPIIVWETRQPEGLVDACERAGVPLVHMEDGFLRSFGLGAGFQPGLSYVVDDLGIYFDPSRPSRLEAVLQEGVPDNLVVRAAKLSEAVVSARLTKYNVGQTRQINVPDGKRVVAVVGQVEDDLSVQRGSHTVRSNEALVQAARARHPDAFLIYKPHPDVEAGLRLGKVSQETLDRDVDWVARTVSITDLFDVAEHIETMTSLAGFEALLRGLTVTCHGQPFYAGWGLTEDLDPIERRTRHLNLDQLVAGALIAYPRYADPLSGLPCPVERIIERMQAAQRNPDATWTRPSALGLVRGRLNFHLVRLRQIFKNRVGG